MPCTFTGSIEGDRAFFAERDLKEASAKLTELTQALCEAVKTLRDNKVALPPKVESFARNHDETDRKRKEKEAREYEENLRKIERRRVIRKLRKSAKAKLTDEEREVLGL